MPDRPRYQIDQTYLWNYEHAPEPVSIDVPAMPSEWSFCGLPVASPLGMPAGPLLNGRWILYYASLGFDVLTYKTVRSTYRDCFPLPNLVPVVANSLTGRENSVPESPSSSPSWAVSFGMPSMTPDDWRRDIEWTRSRLPSEKVLSVSVVGSVQPTWTIDDLANDYAQCAAWAVESGADVVEVNFSCPNVATCDGQLYQHPRDAALVAAEVRRRIGTVPLVIKVGHVHRRDEAESLVDALSPWATSLAMTNTLATTVIGRDGQLLFDGQRRGICGAATLQASVGQTQLFHEVVRSQQSPLKLIGIGGAATWDDVRRYLQVGAEAVHIATAAMLDPSVALSIRATCAGTN